MFFSERARGIEISCGQIEVELETDILWNDGNRSPFPNPNTAHTRRVIDLTQVFSHDRPQWEVPKNTNFTDERGEAWVKLYEGRLR